MSLPGFQCDSGPQYVHTVPPPTNSGTVVYGQMIPTDPWMGLGLKVADRLRYPILWTQGSINSFYNYDLETGLGNFPGFYYRPSAKTFCTQGFSIRTPRIVMFDAFPSGGINKNSDQLYQEFIDGNAEFWDEHGIDCYVYYPPDFGLIGPFGHFHGFGNSYVKFEKTFQLGNFTIPVQRLRVVIEPELSIGAELCHIVMRTFDTSYGQILAQENFGYPFAPWPELQAWDVAVNQATYERFGRFSGKVIHYAFEQDLQPGQQGFYDKQYEKWSEIYTSMTSQLAAYGWTLLQPGAIKASQIAGFNEGPDPVMAATISGLLPYIKTSFGIA